jgi:hypothetical protein
MNQDIPEVHTSPAERQDDRLGFDQPAPGSLPLNVARLRVYYIGRERRLRWP